MTVSGYNSTPPSDDGSQTTANQVTWAKHKTKLGDPLKTAIESLNTNVSTAFATVDDASNLTTGTLPDARLSSNVPLKDALNTFTKTYTSGAPTGSAAIVISAAVPMLVFNETDAAADNKIWDFAVSSEQFLGQVSTDAGGIASWVVVNRTAGTIDSVAFTATAMTLNGNNVATTNNTVNLTGNQTVAGTKTFSSRPQTSSAGGFLSHASGTNTGGSVTLSTSAASGSPAAGDVWIQHEA